MIEFSDFSSKGYYLSLLVVCVIVTFASLFMFLWRDKKYPLKFSTMLVDFILLAVVSFVGFISFYYYHHYSRYDSPIEKAAYIDLRDRSRLLPLVDRKRFAIKLNEYIYSGIDMSITYPEYHVLVRYLDSSFEYYGLPKACDKCVDDEYKEAISEMLLVDNLVD